MEETLVRDFDALAAKYMLEKLQKRSADSCDKQG